MPTPDEYFLFVLAALLLVLTPGPNVVYLISRSVCQGRKAGIISLVGIISGFMLHMLATAAGLSAIFMAFPAAYLLLKICGACYLFWLAWQSIRPSKKSLFETKTLHPVPPKKLLLMGFATSALNPKIAVFYLSLFPQFIHPENGSVFLQSSILGLTQICMSFIVNLQTKWQIKSQASSNARPNT